jgi:hypothetical protein
MELETMLQRLTKEKEEVYLYSINKKKISIPFREKEKKLLVLSSDNKDKTRIRELESLMI